MKFLSLIAVTFMFSALNFSQAKINKNAAEMDSAVQTAIQPHLLDMKSCYTDLLKTDSSAGGKVVLDIQVDEAGKVVASKVNPNKSRWQTNEGRGKEGLSLAKMEVCLDKKMKALILPAAPKGEKVYVSYPFIFGSR